MRIKTTDLIANFFKSKGIKQVFGVTGGAAVHLFDSYFKKKFKIIFTHHEQSAAFASCSYYKSKEKMAICTTTTGPGCTNSITGLAAAWQDSIPSLFISGQARSNQLSINSKTRQVGTQEINSIDIVKSITKMSITLDEKDNINQVLSDAYNIALSGRPGPVWIEVPLDLQLKFIENKPYLNKKIKSTNLKKSDSIKISKIKKLISTSKLPLIVAGGGIISSNTSLDFNKFIKKFNIPYVCTWLGVNLSKLNPPLYQGRIGISGQRGANILINNCDLLIVLGSHLCLPQTGVNVDIFSKKSKKILINIDKKEYKASKIKFNKYLKLDLKLFFKEINKEQKKISNNLPKKQLKKLKSLNDIDGIHRLEKNKINQYYFISCLNKLSKGDENYIIDGGGTNVYISYQALELKKKQKIFHTASICAMGSGLPEAIGAATNKKNIICLIGDGSIMFNMQELQTIKTNKLSVKIIVFNNSGYVSIRDTQRDFLNSKFYGSSKSGGIEITNIKKISAAFGYNYIYLNKKKDIKKKITSFLKLKSNSIMEVCVDEKQMIAPKQMFIKSKKGIGTPSGLDNMYPQINYKSFLKF